MEPSYRRRVPADSSDDAPRVAARRGSRRVYGVITRSGSYLLERDMAATAARPAIRVLANDVTLDLDGHRLTGPGNRVGVGISIEGVSSVRVFNGRGARLGIGVRIQDSNNVTVDGLQIVGEDLGGPPPEIEIGILVVNSRAVVLTNNAISRVFLGIFIRGGGSGGNRIAMNTLTGDANGALGICYNPSPTPGASDGPQGDLVYGNLISRFGTGIATSAASIGNVFRGNTIAYFTAAVDEATPGSNVFEENAAVQITP